MFGPEEPKILSISGDVIRKLMEAYIAHCDVVLASYRKAQADGLAGRDWLRDIEAVKGYQQGARYALPVIADGPHVMSFSQWISIRNQWGDVRNASELIEFERDRQAAAAGERQRAANAPAA